MGFVQRNDGIWFAIGANVLYIYPRSCLALEHVISICLGRMKSRPPGTLKLQLSQFDIHSFPLGGGWLILVWRWSCIWSLLRFMDPVHYFVDVPLKEFAL